MTTSGLTTADYRHLFARWGKKHGREYMTDEEHDSRLSAFMANDALIKSHNANPRHTYKLGHNEFSDLTFDEFKALYMPHHEHPNAPTVGNIENELIELADSAPVSKDWVAEGAVNPVQNQGQCGSCWAFSSTSAAEGADFISTKVLKKFSEQDLIDCDNVGAYGNSGCNGGVIDYAFMYMAEHGQCLESDYPYTESQGSCDAGLYDRTQLKIKSFKQVPPNNEDALKAAVAQQPVSVAIQADQSHFQFYQSGVLTASGCGENLDHAVVAVGYGVDGDMGYWKVRNSWGTTWGEGGYVRMERGVGGSGTCGIASIPSYPTYDSADNGFSLESWIIFFVLVGIVLFCFGACCNLFNRWRYRRGQRGGGGMEPLLGGGDMVW